MQRAWKCLVTLSLVAGLILGVAGLSAAAGPGFVVRPMGCSLPDIAPPCIK